MLCVNTGFVQYLNDKYLTVSEAELAALEEAAEENVKAPPPTLLKEVFEFVHIFVFVVMAIFIVETSVMLIVISNGTRRLRDYENRPVTVECETLNRSSKKWLRFFGLQQRFVGNGPSITSLINRCDPAAVHAPFAAYLALTSSEIIVEALEIPTSSLLALLCLVPLLRPVMTIYAMSYVVAMIIFSVYLLAGSLLFAYLARKAFQKIAPRAADVKNLLQDERLLNVLEEEIREQRSQEVPEQLDAYSWLSAPIDDAPIIIRDGKKMRSSTDALFPAKRPAFLMRMIQFWLVTIAAFIASLIVTATAGTKGASDSWGRYGRYGWPPIIIAVSLSLLIWPRTLELISRVSVLEFGVDRHALRELKEEEDERINNADRSLWRLLLRRSRYVRQKGVDENLNKTHHERAMEAFTRLPLDDKQAIEMVFTSLCQHTDSLGKSQLIPGVMMKSDLSEALRCLGISTINDNAKHTDTHKSEQIWTASDSIQFLQAQQQDAAVTEARYFTFEDFVFLVLSSSDEVVGSAKMRREKLRREREAFFTSLDRDGSGGISFNEFREAVKLIVPNQLCDEEIERIFKRMTGSLSAEIRPSVVDERLGAS